MINHAERSPADCADAASSAIRALNHLALDPRLYVLDEVYAVLGALGEMTARLEQSTVQIRGHARGKADRGRAPN